MKTIYTQNEFEEAFPLIYGTLPEQYQYDGCLEFLDDGGVFLAYPIDEEQEKTLGFKEIYFSRKMNRWEIVA